MKTVLKNYSFNAATRVITLTDVATVRLDRLALITDTTTNKILYNFADSTVATASVSTNTITLSALQGGEANSDKLRIDYDTDTTDTAFGDTTSIDKVTNLPTTVDTNSGSKSSSTLRVVLATDQPALTNKLLVTPDSVALPANQSVNVSQVAGTTTDTNSGLKSAGTMRVVLATDQPALTNKLLVTPDSVALPANQSVNVAQMNGVATTMGNGVAGTGVQRVAIASDNTAFSVNATLQTGANTIGALTANQSVNNSQINGVTVLMGNGVTGTGSQRVTIASDNTPFAVKTDQTTHGTTDKVAADITQVAGAAISQGHGTAATAIRVELPSDGTGVVTANAGTNLNTSALATSTNLTAGTQKTQIVDGSGNVIGSTTNALDINIKSGNPTSITANAGTNLNTSLLALEAGGNLASIKTDVDNLNLAQGSTTAGQKGNLTLGAVTTAAPTYTTGQSSPLSIDTAGQLRVAGSLSTTPPTDTAPATQNITTVDLVSSTASGANAQSIITGSATANSTASFTISTLESIKVQVTGTWTGTLQSEVSLDGGTTWFIAGIQQTGTAYTVATFTNNFGGGLNVSGMTTFRLRATAAITGTATVKIIGTVNANSVHVANGLNIQDATTQSQKLSVSAAGAAKVDGSAVTQPVSIATAPVLVAGSAIIGKVGIDQTTPGTTNGVQVNAALPAGSNAIGSITNTTFAVTQATPSNLNTVVYGFDGSGNAALKTKAASTAAVAADTSLVVALHPTSPLPTGSNTIGALTANQSVNIAQMNGVTTTMGNGVSGTGVQRVAIASDNTVLPGMGAGATGSAVPANAAYRGGIATTANPSAATAGNLVGSMHDKLGKQVVVGSVRDLKADQATTLTSTTAETTIITAVASTFCDLYGLIVTNTSATATEVVFRDVAAGTARFSIQVPASDTRGFMLSESAAYKQATVNTAWTAQCGTSVASVKINALYVKNI